MFSSLLLTREGLPLAASDVSITPFGLRRPPWAPDAAEAYLTFGRYGPAAYGFNRYLTFRRNFRNTSLWQQLEPGNWIAFRVIFLSNADLATSPTPLAQLRQQEFGSVNALGGATTLPHPDVGLSIWDAHFAPAGHGGNAVTAFAFTTLASNHQKWGGERAGIDALFNAVDEQLKQVHDSGDDDTAAFFYNIHVLQYSWGAGGCGESIPRPLMRELRANRVVYYPPERKQQRCFWDALGYFMVGKPGFPSAS